MRKFQLLCAVMALVYTQSPLRATASMAALDVPPGPTVAPAHNTAVAPGITLIPGTFREGQQPDGNTVIFTAPDGLIVMDTGRHAEHTQQILDFATQTQRPIKAIINSHWHLDHIGGNPRIRDAYPDVHIYASGALEAAKQGFLADYRRDLEGALQQEPNGAQAPGWRNELAIIAAAPLADERIDASGPHLIAGRRLFIHLEKYAVTAGDIWVFDPDTHVLAAGDLVTLPVPFLDTACPRGWKRALADLSRTRFNLLVPGHGAPMRREGFETYQRAFGNLLECAAAPEKPGDACVDGWLHDAGQLIAADDPQRVRKMMSFYVAHSLRTKPESIVKLCGTCPARG
jgi:glyoxylase-like metal-dependent hydrolase (beta-lactamase superfamily II)